MKQLTHIVFDWGDTLMRYFPEKPGAMAHWDYIEVLDGVEKTLVKLSRKYCLAVATNAGVSDTSLMRFALKRGGIESYFSHFFSSKDLGYAKPDMRFFQNICIQMNVRSNHCLFVGNDYKKDIEGAAKSGMKTIFFNHANLIGDFSLANEIVDSFEVIPEAINRIK